MPDYDVSCSANWKGKNYTVTYDCNGGTLKAGYNNSYTVQRGGNWRFTEQSTVCSGNGTATGWVCKTSNGYNITNQIWYDEDRAWNFGYNVTCTAGWMQRYPVTYNCNGGSGSVSDSNSPYSSGSQVTVQSTAGCGTQSGYTLGNSWSCDNGIGDKTGGNTFSMPSANVTCTAQWNNERYNVTYVSGNCAGSDYVHTNAAAYGENYLPYSGTGIDAGTGYVFKGWSKVQNPTLNQGGNLSENDKWTGERPWNRTSDLTVYAICTPKPYSVVYMDGNCGTTEDYDSNGFVDPVEYNQNYNVLGLGANGVSTITPRPGWRFEGWLTQPTWATSVDPEVAAGSNRIIDGNLWLYAMCRKNPYVVEYDCDSSDDISADPVDDKTYYVDSNVLVPVGSANTCRRYGQRFDGWSCVTSNASATPLLVTNNRFTMLAANAKCTAQWVPDTYQVTYDCNGGNNAPQDTVNYVYGDSVETYGTLNADKLNTCARTGYTFKSWMCGEGEGAEEIVQGQSFTIYHDTTCRAQWNSKFYNIAYRSGTCGQNPENWSETPGYIEYGKRFNVARVSDLDDVSIPDGYHFLGWSTQNGKTTSADVEYTYGQYGPWGTNTVGFTANGLVLYGVCELVSCSVGYNYNGGHLPSGATEVSSYNVTTTNQSIPDAVRDGYYRFDGWYDNPEFTGTPITSIDDILANGYRCGITLYAKWTNTGKLRFVCPDVEAQEMTGVLNDVVTAPAQCDNFGECSFRWNCDGLMTVNPGENTTISQSVLGRTVVCTPVKDCSNVLYNITYNVFKFEEGQQTAVQQVYLNETPVAVNALTPRTYKTDHSEAYPVVSLPGCGSVVWYENPNFTGNPVTATPMYAANQEGRNIVLYGKIDCGYMCNEPGHEHWLHIGGSENNKVCLYENRQTNLTPVVRVGRSDKRKTPYYLMLTTDLSAPIHAGSDYKMHVEYNGTPYNVCDRSVPGCRSMVNMGL